MPSTSAAHADHGEDRADDVDLARPRVGHVVDELDLRQHDRDHDDLEPEADAPREVGGHEATDQRPDRGRDRGRGPTSAYVFVRAAPSKFPWISDCIAGNSSDAPSPPMIAQKTMIAVRLWASVIASAPIA